jgi:Fe-S cluster assembly protein SufD
MVSLPTATTTFDEAALASLPEAAGFTGPLRKQALEEFHSLPLPSQETEEWRYTDVSGLSFDVDPYTPGGHATDLDGVPGHVLDAAGSVGDRAGLLIQHNSDVMMAHLDPELVAAGVRFGDLDAAAAEHPDLIERYLHQLVPTGRTTFTALHGAFRTGGTFLYVPPDISVAIPLQSLTYLDANNAAIFPRTLLIADRGAEVTFIDRLVSPDLERALSDAVVEIFAEAGAHVRYVGLQEWGDGVTHLAVQRARVGDGARVQSFGVAFGGTLSRVEVEVDLVGERSATELLGVYFGADEQHIDHRSIQRHIGSRSSSDLLYKGALKGGSNAIYTGTVVIEAGAHECDAYQTNRNVLLSEHAKAQSVPNLEILTDDPTRCGHAASVGPVSDDELFYLMSRGIPREEAERLIVFGFFNEVLDRLDLPEIRDSVERTIEAELAREA